MLIPVKAFGAAKQRLSGLLTPAERRTLARWMAGRVVAAAAPAPAFVVCDDDEVSAWAESVGATVLWRPGHGLNPAVTDGVASLADAGFDHVVVAHSDLPLATDLPSFAVAGEVTFVPDRVDDGTNVMALPSSLPVTFSYGARSFHRHVEAVESLGVAWSVRRDPNAELDVDSPREVLHPSVLPLVQEVLPSLRTNPANRPR